MKRALLMLTTLVVVCPFLMGQDRGATNPLVPSSGTTPSNIKPVVVDAQDFRRPIEDPQENLVPRYDDKLVRYTGTLVRWGEDKEKKNRWYEVETVYSNAADIPAASGPRQPGKTPDAQKPRKESLVVKFYLRNDEPQLRNSQPGQMEVTVQGRGQVLLGTWQLIVHDATLVNVRPVTPPPRAK